MDKAGKRFARLIRVSTTRIDGGNLFGSIPKERWERFVSPDRQNRVAVGNYSMLIDHPDGWVLVNAGPGDKAPLNLDIAPMRSRSSLLRDLRDLGIIAKDIAMVIYTHMHNEHVGGGTHMTSSGRALPTFPNARYVVQREALEEAERPTERNARYYRADDYEPLRDAGQLDVIDGSSEVASGVWVEPAPGPTAGHQIVISQRGKATYAYLGMLVPTSMHLSSNIAPAADRNPEASCRTRREVRRQAGLESWLVGPVGRDEWVRASELEALDSFSNGEAATPKAPAVKTASRQGRSAAVEPTTSPTAPSGRRAVVSAA